MLRWWREPLDNHESRKPAPTGTDPETLTPAAACRRGWKTTPKLIERDRSYLQRLRPMRNTGLRKAFEDGTGVPLRSERRSVEHSADGVAPCPHSPAHGELRSCGRRRRPIGGNKKNFAASDAAQLSRDKHDRLGIGLSIAPVGDHKWSTRSIRHQRFVEVLLALKDPSRKLPFRSPTLARGHRPR